jgi:hypothetical protein
MNQNPLSALKNFTVPVATNIPSKLNGVSSMQPTRLFEKVGGKTPGYILH